MTDEKLFQLCKMYGARALEARNKFIGLLPEVSRRRLFEKKKFTSIFHFAKVLAGLSEEQVRRVLNIEERLEAMPKLHEVLVNGEASINKLSRVVSIATPENQEFLAEQVKVLPQSALETLVRDEKADVEQKPLFDPKTVRAHTQALQLSEDVKTQLLELQEKGIDINNLLREFLEKRKLELAQEKEKLAAETKQTESRYIPAKIKNHIQKEHGTKCSISNCQKPSEHIHHTQRFSLGKTHNPNYLAPLCKEHHVIAHSIDQKYQQKRRI